ncbi:acyltransferase [Mesohalobacter halotolerans]|uniref:Transferase hexapeptide repeat family protein n=1 Tax=Mesohalobacter halotolerans TaxID=1883405 RepID=A0A4U5TSE2_9FLAO|nr:transferase hexapeptide repeat family protein [Mesohalobacter halotolerans]TKS56942.1 transferase hexapeptide repeat family protein [Mesohalobacter halotolerans]
MAIYKFKNHIPVIHSSSFVHPQATVTGNVIIGKHCYIGPGAAIRGDWGEIILEDGVNVQENCTIHMFPGKSIRLETSAHVGHGAIIHGANLGRNCMVGMNAVIMDDVYIGEESIIGAMTFIKAETNIPPRSLVVGNPGKIIKSVSDDMIAWKTAGTKLYQQLPTDCHKSLEEVEPLREIPKNRPKQENFYETLNEFKNNNSD